MHKIKVVYFTVLVTALVAVFVSHSWAQSVPAGTVPARDTVQTVDAISAVVNSEVITQNEVEKRLHDVIQRMQSQNIALPPVPELRKQLLERMILERAEVQVARENGLLVDDTTLDRAINRIADQNKMSLGQFQQQLEKEKIPYPAFREEIRQEILLQRLREREVNNKIQISDSEIDNYLAAEKENAQQELNLAQILVRVPENASSEQIAERYKRAQSALQEIKSGGNFAAIAAVYSDANDALSGGEIGWRTKDRLPALFVEAVADLKPGQTSNILKSANGFHILKLVNQRTASAVSNEATPAAVVQTHVRHILIKVTPTMSALEARRRLVELKQRLENRTATFEDLAKSYSNDGSAGKGGDLGWIYPGDTVPEFEQAMNALQPGQISDPIESPYGYHLIEVLERKTNSVSQERQRMAARMAIRDRKSEEAMNDWLRQLRDRTYVEYRNNDH